MFFRKRYSHNSDGYILHMINFTTYVTRNRLRKYAYKFLLHEILHIIFVNLSCNKLIIDLKT